MLGPIEAGVKHGLTDSKMQLSPLLKEGMVGTEEPDHKLVSAEMEEAELLA